MDSNKLDTDSRDAISCLPQEVLGDILSLLPTTKLAASTSVLAKNWRHVFRLVHTLDFDDSDLLQPEVGKEERPVIQECFRNFVDRTLALQCGYPIKKFSLRYEVTNNSEVVYVRRWICNVVERCVLEVDLSVMPGRHWEWVYPLDVDEVHGDCLLPCHLFRSKTLVKLSLGTNLYPGKLPPDVSLPVLKSLLMDSVVVDDTYFCDVLLSGCPVLEELTVRHVRMPYSYKISSQTIKKLKVYYDCKYQSYVSFDAPSLVSLDYADYALSSCPLVNMESLVEAKLDLCYHEWTKRLDITGLIIRLSNVQTLHLSTRSVVVICDCVEDGLVLPVFKNLVKLSFGSCNRRGWKLLPYLLKQSPKVETLIIQGRDGYICEVTIGLLQVKVLDVVGYKGSAKEFERLKSLLGGIECMERVRVEFSESVWWTMTLVTLLGVVAASQ